MVGEETETDKGVEVTRPTDLTGRAFGRLMAEARIASSANGKTMWRCRCSCGQVVEVLANSLVSGRTRSCGCFRRECVAEVGAGRIINLTGRRFGRLLVSERGDGLSTEEARWRCRCDCGRITEVRSSTLRHGTTRSCGCLARELARARAVVHGASTTPEYEAWHSMKQRCTNPNHAAWANYGGRGIRVCDEWLDSFEAFLVHVGPKPHPRLTFDRINNDGNYEPGNVRWATWSQQNSNQRRRKRRDRMPRGVA